MVKPKKNGFKKRVTSSSSFPTDQCPFCHRDFRIIADLSDGSPECEQWARKKSSMEATIYECPQCKIRFVYWESYDYDYFHLQEIE